MRNTDATVQDLAPGNGGARSGRIHFKGLAANNCLKGSLVLSSGLFCRRIINEVQVQIVPVPLNASLQVLAYGHVPLLVRGFVFAMESSVEQRDAVSIRSDIIRHICIHIDSRQVFYCSDSTVIHVSAIGTLDKYLHCACRANSGSKVSFVNIGSGTNIFAIDIVSNVGNRHARNLAVAILHTQMVSVALSKCANFKLRN